MMMQTELEVLERIANAIEALIPIADSIDTRLAIFMDEVEEEDIEHDN